ncbi:MAG: hypothetical protein WDO73_20250 [Ignavibacteriota bacterium]
MNRAVRAWIVLACAGLLSGQTQPQATEPQQSAGLESNWEIAPVLQEIGLHATRVLPLLDRADATQWASKGAPAAYAAQLQSSKDQARALSDEAKALAANPEALAGTLQVLFREQGLETLLVSVAEAVRKYQSQPLAQEFVAMAAASGASRDRLEQYVVNLAAERGERISGNGQRSATLPRPGVGFAGASEEEKIGFLLCPFPAVSAAKNRPEFASAARRMPATITFVRSATSAVIVANAKSLSRRILPRLCVRLCTLRLHKRSSRLRHPLHRLRW